MNAIIDQSERKESWRPFVLSVITHTLLLVILFFLTHRSSGTGGQGEPDRRVEVVLAKVNEDSEEFLTEQDLEQEQDVEQTAQSAASSSPSEETPPEIKLPDLEAAGPVVAELPAEVSAERMTDVPDSNGVPTEFELTAEDLKMIAAEQQRLKASRPVGNPASLSLFGSGQLEGRRFVFVMDRSQSMGASGLGVLSRARTELSAAINQLEKHHSFQIVAYHGRTVTISRRALLAATEENKSLVPEFIGGLAAFGSTSHENGLSAGLAFRPDVLVFMTDGGLPTLNNGQLEIVNLMARGSTQIHCLQFGMGPLQDDLNFMMKIARQNNGTYQYIDVTKW